jgi:signal transduction histidine kinase
MILSSKNTIFIKIFRLFFIALVFVSTLFAIYAISTQKKEILKSLEVESKSMEKLITFILSDALVLNDSSYIVEFTTDFIKNNSKLDNIIISKLDKSYFIIKKNEWLYAAKLDNKFLELEKKEETSLILSSSILNKEVFHYTSPIFLSGTQWGWIHLSMSLDEYYKKVLSMYIEFFTFFTILFLISIIISYILAKSISKPIIDLNNIATNISKGNLKLRSNYTNNDELGALSQTFNNMISAIDETQTQLKLSHEELENRVEKRTKELDNTNKLLNNKKNELEELNKNLDKKVKDEIEKRQKQENLLIQQSRLAAIGEMMGNIAHQWRQPLSVITTCASGIKLEKEFGISNSELEVEKLDSIINSSNYLSNTIEDFRNFFKPNKQMSDFSIEEMAIQSLALVNSSLNFHHIKLEKNFNTINSVYGYSNEFSQAVLNVLSNAKDALVENNVVDPKIKVNIYENEDFGFLEIEDNAGGINQDILNKIFEPYFTTKHKNQGTGIGLYMSKMIIEENMNGKLIVENIKNGARFIFAIPKI